MRQHWSIETGIRQGISLFLLVSAAWLVQTLWWVRLELDDGYSTLVNAWYFSGGTEAFAWQRGPLMGLLLAPVVTLAESLGIARSDVRPAHLAMVALHLLYLVATWRALVRELGPRPAVAMAYLGAIPTVLFFSYAPFISHDLFPGLLTLWLVLAAGDYLAAPLRQRWLQLLALGYLLAMVKQTYALVWPAVLLVNLVLVLALRERGRWRAYAGLAGAALAGGALTWLSYALALASRFPDDPWWSLPLVQAANVVNQYAAPGVAESLFYPGVYLRNLPAHGILAACLVLPGIALALHSGSRRLREIAGVWLLLAVCVALLGTREVRYLGFLAPLTAFLVALPIERLLRTRKALAWPLLAILMLDLGRAGSEAAAVANPWYARTLPGFLAPLAAPGPATQRILVVNSLSFVAPSGAFFGDRYHRITHVHAQHVEALFGSRERAVRAHASMDALTNADFADGDVLLYANQVIVRAPPIQADNRTNLRADFMQILAIADTVELRREGAAYRLNPARGPGGNYVLVRTPAGQGLPLLASSGIAPAELERLTGSRALPDVLTLRALRIASWCGAQGCRSLD